MEEYKAKFEIDCGVSPGYGVKYPDNVKLDKVYSAKDKFEALKEAARLAIGFGQNYLSNPENDLTTVTINSLQDSKGNLIELLKVLEENGFKGIERFELAENKMVFKYHMLEHLLDHGKRIAEESSKKN